MKKEKKERVRVKLSRYNLSELNTLKKILSDVIREKEGFDKNVYKQAHVLINKYPVRADMGGYTKTVVAKAIKKAGFKPLMSAVVEYSKAVAEWPEEEKKYIPSVKNWFMNERWRDDRNTWYRPKEQKWTST